jgi:hypothetical protein
MFKNLKASMEGIQEVIQKIEERRIHQVDIHDLKKQILAQQQKSNSEKVRLLINHSVNLEHLKSKHETDMQAICQEEETIIEKEMPALTADIHILQNELLVTESRLHNIQKEKLQLERGSGEYQKMIEHAMSFKNSVEWKEQKENEEMQHFEVRLYNQTII